MGDKKTGKESRCPENGGERRRGKPKYGEKNRINIIDRMNWRQRTY